MDIATVDQLDALPIGSVVMWVDPTEPESPAVACRAVRGWQFLGDLDDRRYESDALVPTPQPIRVLYDPSVQSVGFDPGAEWTRLGMRDGSSRTPA